MSFIRAPPIRAACLVYCDHHLTAQTVLDGEKRCLLGYDAVGRL
jgi:hypothetical protein